MKLRQSREKEFLGESRLLQPGEIDDRIDRAKLVRAPEPAWTASTLYLCEDIYDRFVSPGTGGLLPDALFCDLPKWHFLEYAIRHKRTLLFGSNRGGLDQLEPIQLSTNLSGWNRPRYFAFGTSVEAIFHAILDLPRLKALDCPNRSSVALPFGAPSRQPGFYFGLDYRALPEAPWRVGTIYLYHVDDFPSDYAEKPFETSEPIRPLARLKVVPHDWPLLRHVSGVDLVAQSKRQLDTFDGYPWQADGEIHPHLWKRPLVEAARQHLDAHFAEPVSLSSLGKLVGASPFGALRLFQAEFGISPREYQTNLRIEYAKHLLRQGLPIADVAAECGFCDQTHLNRHFRAKVAMTPGQYLRAQDRPIPSG